MSILSREPHDLHSIVRSCSRSILPLGSIETLTLTGGLRCVEGKHLHRIHAADREHFFTPDGHYDGWGRALNATPPEEAMRLRGTLEALREVDDPLTA